MGTSVTKINTGRQSTKRITTGNRNENKKISLLKGLASLAIAYPEGAVD